MKNILICPDIHFCQNSSIIRERGEKYSARLENCIKSINWVMQTAKKENCSSIFYLGDFFNRSDLNAEEITALSSIDFDIGLNQFIIVGNHEAKTADNIFNSSNCLRGVNVFDHYQLIEDDKTAIHLLPYMYDCVEDISQVLTPVAGKRNLILSHNDLKGVNYGNFISTTGIDLDSIESNCDLFINGHLHNNSWVTKKILNLGILTGQNFSEDCTKYVHQIAILDLDAFHIKLIENPYAFNFTKLEVGVPDYLEVTINSISKSNLVLYVKCPQDVQPEVKQILEKYKKSKKVFTYKIITEKRFDSSTINIETKLLKINPLKDLRECVINYVDGSELARSELDILCN